MKKDLKQKKETLSKKELNLIQKEITSAHSDHQSKLLRKALYRTSSRNTSQDLVQTTFLKTLLYLQKGGKIDIMYAFLNHILNDLIVDEYRSRKKKIMSLDALLEKGFEPGSSSFERDINFLDGKGVVLLVPLLSRKYELVIHQRYLKGMSIKEIAQITDQSENTVAVQVHRGMKKLRKLYKEHSLE